MDMSKTAIMENKYPKLTIKNSNNIQLRVN